MATKKVQNLDARIAHLKTAGEHVAAAIHEPEQVYSQAPVTCGSGMATCETPQEADDSPCFLFEAERL